MTPERYRQVGEIYHAALEVDHTERAAFLESACAGDVVLRGEVESLIDSHEQAGDFMSGSALAVAAEMAARSDSQELIGRMFARYRISSLLGAGGMGRVFLAEDTDLGRRVALKLLPEFAIDDRQQVRRLQQEARAASALNHPNIVTIHEIGRIDSVDFIAAEYIDGETLRRRLAAGPMTLQEALDIATQVASALHAAHDAGIVHRDIKPENIMLRRDGIAKVLDFGLAKLALPRASTTTDAPTHSIVKTTPGMIMGTVGYMSPEQARGHDVDARTDIWSFGVVLYEMLTRTPPFAGETPSDVIAAILTAEPAPLVRHAPDTPAEMQRIVRKCLEKNREERYQTAKELLADLRQLQKRLELAGAPAARIIFDSKRLRRAIAASVIALAVAAAAWFAYRGRQTAGTQIDSLAVMPFSNDGGDPQTDYLSDGITESLIGRLSQSGNLKVMSRNSVFRFKGQPVDAHQISTALGVRAVMMGHLNRIGDQLFIGVELVDARDGSVIWTRQYVRKMADVIAVQTNLARDITESLRLQLSGAQQQQLGKRDTDNVEAYELYLKGRYFWNKNQRTAEDFRKSFEYYQRAIDLDPNFAMAYAELSRCYTQQIVYLEAPARGSLAKARAAAMKAVELDDRLPEGHHELGWSKLVFEHDRIGAEREFKRAIELNPNYALGHHTYGAYFTALGRFDEAMAERRVALQLDPLSAPLRAATCWTLYFARRYDAAIAECREALALEENFFRAHLYIGLAYEQKRMYREAMAEMTKALTLSPANAEVLASLAHVYAASGNRVEAERIAAEVNDLSRKRQVDPYFVALIHLGFGETDQAFRLLQEAFDDSSIMLLWLRIEPRLDGIRSDGRYLELVQKMGLEE